MSSVLFDTSLQDALRFILSYERREGREDSRDRLPFGWASARLSGQSKQGLHDGWLTVQAILSAPAIIRVSWGAFKILQFNQTRWEGGCVFGMY